jgi:uncharacterized repeat protein (TIGR03803 family)
LKLRRETESAASNGAGEGRRANIARSSRQGSRPASSRGKSRAIVFELVLILAMAAGAACAASPATVYSFGTGGAGDGAQPKGSLTNVNGTLFGRTTSTFINLSKVTLGGIIFSYSPAKAEGMSSYQILHTFPAGSTDGENPRHDAMTLVSVDSTPTLFGTTLQGGNGGGTIFSIAADGTGYASLLDFEDSTGDEPHSCFVEINDVLYAMAAAGGDHGQGVIYSIKPDGTGYTVLKSFKKRDGGQSHGRLTWDGKHLFGMTRKYGPVNKNHPAAYGVIFRVDLDGSNYKVLHTFHGGKHDGASTDHGYLVLDPGKPVLYGMTTNGGHHNDGVVFQIGTDGSGFQLLHKFGQTAKDGRNPYGSLLLNGSDLYGTTGGGGSHGDGTVFHIATDGTGYLRLHDFAGGVDGRKPIDNVILLDNTLYGMTVFGGSFNEGTIFAIPLDR